MHNSQILIKTYFGNAGFWHWGTAAMAKLSKRITKIPFSRNLKLYFDSKNMAMVGES